MTGTSPEVARRRLRLVLRDSRIEAEITQQEAASRVLWSLSKLVRVENGSSPPTPADARILMMEYGASQEKVAEIIELAKVARQPTRWDVYKDAFSAESRSLFANEAAASQIAKHEPSFVPGLLQTEDYARSLLRALDVDSGSIEVRVRVRLERQELLDSADGPSLEFVLGEAAVSRPIGGNEIMRRQIEYLKTISQRPKITLRLLPFAAGPYAGMGVSFTILEFRDPQLPDLVYLESGGRETIVRDNRDEVRRYLSQFAKILEVASPPESFIDQIDAIATMRLDSG